MKKTDEQARVAGLAIRRRAMAMKLRNRGLEGVRYAWGEFLMTQADVEKILALIEVAREVQLMEEGT